MKPREEVEVEASDAHNRVVCVLLVRNEEVGGGIPVKDEAVVVVSILNFAW